MTGKLLNVSKAAQYIGVPPRTLYNWLKKGTFSAPPIPGTKPPKWSRTTLDAWLKGRAGS